MTSYTSNPLQMITAAVRHRQLIVQLVKRDIASRYRGSSFGLLWSLFQPILMLAVYTFVFSVVFKARWHTNTDSKTEFALALFIGLIAHGILAESINRAPSLILANANYVTKVVFPLEILPWIALGATLFHSLISLIVWVSFYLMVNQTMHWTAIFLPIILVPLIFFSMGFLWLFAAVGVYLRDLSQITNIFTTVLLFMSPIFYPVSSLPEKYQAVFHLNPLTLIVEQSRWVLMEGRLPEWQPLGISFLMSLLLAWIGFVFFQKARKGFSDVL